MTAKCRGQTLQRCGGHPSLEAPENIFFSSVGTTLCQSKKSRRIHCSNKLPNTGQYCPWPITGFFVLVGPLPQYLGCGPALFRVPFPSRPCPRVPNGCVHQGDKTLWFAAIPSRSCFVLESGCARYYQVQPTGPKLRTFGRIRSAQDRPPIQFAAASPDLRRTCQDTAMDGDYFPISKRSLFHESLVLSDALHQMAQGDDSLRLQKPRIVHIEMVLPRFCPLSCLLSRCCVR